MSGVANQFTSPITCHGEAYQFMFNSISYWWVPPPTPFPPDLSILALKYLKPLDNNDTLPHKPTPRQPTCVVMTWSYPSTPLRWVPGWEKSPHTDLTPTDVKLQCWSLWYQPERKLPTLTSLRQLVAFLKAYTSWIPMHQTPELKLIPNRFTTSQSSVPVCFISYVSISCW